MFSVFKAVSLRSDSDLWKFPVWKAEIKSYFIKKLLAYRYSLLYPRGDSAKFLVGGAAHSFKV